MTRMTGRTFRTGQLRGPFCATTSRGFPGHEVMRAFQLVQLYLL